MLAHYGQTNCTASQCAQCRGTESGRAKATHRCQQHLVVADKSLRHVSQLWILRVQETREQPRTACIRRPMKKADRWYPARDCRMYQSQALSWARPSRCSARKKKRINHPSRTLKASTKKRDKGNGGLSGRPGSILCCLRSTSKARHAFGPADCPPTFACFTCSNQEQARQLL